MLLLKVKTYNLHLWGSYKLFGRASKWLESNLNCFRDGSWKRAGGKEAREFYLRSIMVGWLSWEIKVSKSGIYWRSRPLRSRVISIAS